MSEAAGHDHREEQQDAGRARKQPQGQQRPAGDLREHGHPRLDRGHRNTQFLEPSHEAGHVARSHQAEFSEPVDHEADANEHAHDPQG